jgi:Tol biopolymer transport system component
VEKSVRRGLLRRLASVAAVALAAGLIQASSCDDNLGNVKPGPVRFRVSVGPDTAQANGGSFSPSVSGDGRYVIFASNAKNLALPTSNFREIFLRDRWTDTVQNVTRVAFLFDQPSAQDCDFPFISENGDWAVMCSKGDFTESGFYYGPHDSYNVFRWDRITNTFSTVLFTWPSSGAVDRDVTNVSISNDGNYVCFQTSGDNFGFTTNGNEQVFVADFSSGVPIISLISKAMGGPATQGCNDHAFAPRISSDGQFVVFQSKATDLVATPLGGKYQIFLAARDGSSMAIVSRADGGAGAVADNDCAVPTLSGDGRYISFVYGGGALVPGSPAGSQVIRRDRNPSNPAQATTSFVLSKPLSLFSTGCRPGISNDGRYVSSYIIVPDALGGFGDLKVQVRDMQGGVFDAMTGFVGSSGGNLGQLPGQDLSADGRWCVFMSLDENQVVGDTNAAVDVFGYGPIH